MSDTEAYAQTLAPLTLAELHNQLASSFTPSTRKDLQTAVRVLARAFACPDPDHCHLDTLHRSLPDIYARVEDYLFNTAKPQKPIQPHTVRNIKNLLSRLFRFAEAQQLWSPTPAPLLRQYNPRKRPARMGSQATQLNGTYLPYAQWPPDLQDAFGAFETWATAPLVPERPSSFKKRPVTVRQYRISFEAYFGFLRHIHTLPTVTFDHLFDFDLVHAFVQWHVNDVHQRPTNFIRRFLQFLLTLTNQYRPLPDLRTRVATLRNTIPIPPPVYRKEDAWVSLATLEEIGRALWPRKLPHQLKQSHLTQPGLFFASRAGFSLMFRLWTYIPYRQRNMREMQLGDNLYKDADGRWRIAFQGEQMKIATKRGRTNVFDLKFPPQLVPILEDYLTLWRPILLARASQPLNHVFLTRYGNPFEHVALTQNSKALVYRYTGKHWHPHIVRTVWATEWIKKTHGDFYTAAIMLNDRLETVIAKYTHLLEEDVAEKAYRLIEERNGQGT